MNEHNSKKTRLRAEKDWSRIDLFLSAHLPHLSRTKIEKLIKAGRVKLNEKTVRKKSESLHLHDRVEVEIAEDIRETPAPQISPLAFKKLFEDDHLLIIDKPSGISVHPGAGESRETILDHFKYLYPQVKGMRDAERPGIVHRLDKDTSGILILAKDEHTMRRMQKKFKRREVDKTYLALARGRLRYRNGRIDVPLARSKKSRWKFTAMIRITEEDMPGVRPAVTEFSVLYEFGDFSLVRLSPHTGRTHQLRVHLAHFGNPILGDRLYGKGSDFERLALHASAIAFNHPITGHLLTVSCPLPQIFRTHMMQAIHHHKQTG